MCEHGDCKTVEVKVPADLSHTGEPQWKEVQVDACIAPIVEVLQRGGIDMRGSCCGHGKRMGNIHLQDGRFLFIHTEGTRLQKPEIPTTNKRRPRDEKAA